MRPLILKMSGFGPYAEETVIPMEDLGEQGLYLITGDTGAGKTTIFDAICYALYGEASGPTREVSMFRSKYADPDTPTRVELTFLHNGKTYRIERNPEYYRPKKSGNGETKQTAGVNFYLPDGQVISKQGDVAKAVEELLGLTRNQFSQISMLAQGDFLKLLLASTKDRQEIFRKIFQTDLYQKLQNEIDENRREVAFATERAQNSVKQYIQDITCDENDVLSQDLRRAKDGDMLITEVLELIAGIVEHDGESAGKSRELLSELQKQVEEVNRRIGELEILDKERINLENARRKMTVLTAQKEPLQLRLEHAKEAWGKKDEYTREAAKLEKELPDYEKAGNLKAETAKLEAELKRMQTGYAALSEEIKQKTELLQKAEQELEGLKNAGESLAKLKADEEKASLFQDQIKAIMADLKEYDAANSEMIKAQRAFKEADDQYNTTDHEYKRLFNIYLSGQAGLLAMDLIEGRPCPVCGSLTHPSPAFFEEEIPSKEAVDQAEAKLAEARNRAVKLSEEASNRKTVANTMVDQIRKKAKDLLGGSEEIDQIRAAAETFSETILEGLTRTRSAIKTEEQRVARKKAIEEKLPSLKTELEQKAQLERTRKDEITALEASLTAKTEQYRELAASLKYSGHEEVKKRIEALNQQAGELQKAYDKAAEDTRQLDKDMDTCLGMIGKLEESIAGYDPAELSAKKELAGSLKEQENEKNRILQTLTGRIERNESLSDRIRSGAEKISQLEKRLQWMTNLSETAGGKLSGKNKIMLETYIQMTYFDRIIARANLRLIRMTANQYELKRTEEPGSLKSQSGLELSVIDHHNGSERSVKTLSGGESFMASLALALGLSDEVQSSAGGIRVDTMFVDEGFGSLDPESLDQAYRALVSLTEGNQLVGIISHVADLKAKIDRQIVVTKDKDGGSHAVINV